MALNHQIFFGRPSGELSLKMLRESNFKNNPSSEDDFSTMKDHVSRCFDVTAAVLDDEILEGKDDPFSCIYYDQGADECVFE